MTFLKTLKLNTRNEAAKHGFYFQLTYMYVCICAYSKTNMYACMKLMQEKQQHTCL